MFKFTNILVRSTKNNIAFNNVLRLNCYSSLSNPVEAKGTVETPHENEVKTEKQNVHGLEKKHFNSSAKTGIVAAAFASLQTESTVLNSGIATPAIDGKIANAKNINDLLSISIGNGVSRRHALKVVSTLANWSSTGKVNMSDFETDPRFLKLCKILAKGMTITRDRRSELRNEDLSTIFTVTAEDEAAKLVSSISLTQMIKVMSLLSLKRRRSILLLRSLAFNITKSPEKLNAKQCADLLYSMSILNFPELTLLERIKNDIFADISNCDKKSAVIGSILTSLGLLKYKDTALLDLLTSWMQEHHDICRPQDIASLFLTLAVLNYEPGQLDKLYEVSSPHVSISDVSKTTIWLDFVWSLVLLNRATPAHVESVLSEKFISTIPPGHQGISSILKLQNVNAASELLMENYNGPKLKDELRSTNIIRTKYKQHFVESVYETLKNLMQADVHLKKDINTGMGFYIDVYCALDKKCNPVALEKVTGDHTKIAIMILDYRDVCIGKEDYTGMNTLAFKLLEKQGYKVMTVPYLEYNPTSKLVDRVKYIEKKLKSLV